MQKLTVELGERAYPIYIGSGLLKQPELMTRHIPGQSTMLVSNETVAPLYLEAAQAPLAALRSRALILPDGEQYKTLASVEKIYTALLEHRFDRNATLLALGGGVIGDISGFAAASYQRGIHFIQIPTTLLAQVDSSVGGKTGVNHPLGKNMIGAFYQPRCVIIDTDTLNTLDDRQLSAGIAEIIKYGLINDIGFLQWLETNMDALRARDPQVLAEAIYRSCENKARVVAADEREGGQRALLNLGHTFGHAIETGMGYGAWLHGEAVGCGMLMAAQLSKRLGWLSDSDVARIEHLLQRAGLPTRAPAQMSPERFLELMAVDKKVIDGKLRLVLLKAVGEALISEDFDPQALRETLDHAHAA